MMPDPTYDYVVPVTVGKAPYDNVFSLYIAGQPSDVVALQAANGLLAVIACRTTPNLIVEENFQVGQPVATVDFGEDA
jgi:hypothetical protein